MRSPEAPHQFSLSTRRRLCARGAATMGCVMPARMFSKAQPSCASRRQQITARAAVITSVPVVGLGPLSLSAGKATLVLLIVSPYDQSVSSSLTGDPRRLAEDKASEVAAMSWEELDAYGERIEEVTTPSGQRFRVKSIAFWDMEAWASAMYVIVKVYPSRGLRRFLGYSAVETRGGWDDDEPIPPGPAR
jgi:hypothetical protein